MLKKSIAYKVVFIFLLFFESLGFAHTQTNSTLENAPSQGYYIVKKDDTLYSIAWQFGLDYRVIAAMNHLSPPYALVAGESLFLVEKGNTAPAGLGNPPVIVKHLPHANTNPSVAVSPAAVSTVSTSQQMPATVSVPQSTSTTASTKWVWPTHGKVVNNYSTQPDDLNKGIDIKGTLGQSIVASATGEVVYSGNGIPGYGNLIIIKHNADYLTAYAHNQKNLVKEGQHVKVGQAIALMGKGNTGIPLLHFEIRYRGKPVNPSKFLSKGYA